MSDLKQIELFELYHITPKNRLRVAFFLATNKIQIVYFIPGQVLMPFRLLPLGTRHNSKEYSFSKEYILEVLETTTGEVYPLFERDFADKLNNFTLFVEDIKCGL